MEIYHYWAIIGFIFLILGFFIPRTVFLVLSGATFFASIFAFKFPENFYLQFGSILFMAPLFFVVIKKHFKKGV